jgi:hypothetical protein
VVMEVMEAMVDITVMAAIAGIPVANGIEAGAEVGVEAGATVTGMVEIGMADDGATTTEA